MKLLEELFEVADKIHITVVTGEGVIVNADGSSGFTPYELVEEFGIIDAVERALQEVLDGLGG